MRHGMHAAHSPRTTHGGAGGHGRGVLVTPVTRARVDVDMGTGGPVTSRGPKCYPLNRRDGQAPAATVEAPAGAAQLRNLRCSEGSARRGSNAHSTGLSARDARADLIEKVESGALSVRGALAAMTTSR
jgi:hypothetical protein